MKVINFFAGAGCGKSTTAAGLFFLMKTQGYNVELVTEFAKQLVWQERKATFPDQLYILAKQNHKLFALKGKVDYAITDSPLLLSSIYAPENYIEGFEKTVKSIFDTYENINFFINRVKPYKQAGRNETEAGAREKDAQIKNYLNKEKIPYMVVDGNNLAPEVVLSKLSFSI